MNEKKVNKKKALLIGGALIGSGIIIGGVATYLYKKNVLDLKDVVTISNETNDWILTWKPTDFGLDVDLKVITEQILNNDGIKKLK